MSLRAAVSYTHLDVYKRQVSNGRYIMVGSLEDIGRMSGIGRMYRHEWFPPVMPLDVHIKYDERVGLYFQAVNLQKRVQYSGNIFLIAFLIFVVWTTL